MRAYQSVFTGEAAQRPRAVAELRHAVLGALGAGVGVAADVPRAAALAAFGRRHYSLLLAPPLLHRGLPPRRAYTRERRRQGQPRR